MEAFADYIHTEQTEGCSSGDAEQWVDNQTRVNYYDIVQSVKLEIEEYTIPIEEYEVPIEVTQNICSSKPSDTAMYFPNHVNDTIVKLEEGEPQFERTKIKEEVLGTDTTYDSRNGLQADPIRYGLSLAAPCTGAPPSKKIKTEPIFVEQNVQGEMIEKREDSLLKTGSILTEEVIIESDKKGKKKINPQTSTYDKSVDKSIACKKCKCKNNTDLKNHNKIHAGLETSTSNIINIDSAKELFTCTRCDYKSISRSKLMRHVRIHTGEKPFACNVCDYKCNDKSSLMRHLKRHTGEKPFACNICEYKCVTKSDLNIHTKRHSGEKQFTCDSCDYKCVTKTNLKQHIIIHIGDKPFVCPECDYRSNYKSHLKRHVRIHTGKRASGDICNKSNI